MIETVSKLYHKDHCICYDVKNTDGALVAIKIIPENGYHLIHEEENGTKSELYGFMLLNVNSIDTFNDFMAVGSDDELTAEEALAIITGEENNETK